MASFEPSAANLGDDEDSNLASVKLYRPLPNATATQSLQPRPSLREISTKLATHGLTAPPAAAACAEDRIEARRPSATELDRPRYDSGHIRVRPLE